MKKLVSPGNVVIVSPPYPAVTRYGLTSFSPHYTEFGLDGGPGTGEEQIFFNTVLASGDQFVYYYQYAGDLTPEFDRLVTLVDSCSGGLSYNGLIGGETFNKYVRPFLRAKVGPI